MLETILNSDDVAERCGFVLTSGELVELNNIAEEPEKSYEIDPVAALPYVKAGAIAATWHTHPNADPNLSGDDHEGFLLWPDLEHCIIGVFQGKVTVRRYRVEDGLVIACG